MTKALKSFRTNIIAGMIVLLPLVTTAYVFFKLFKLVDSLLPNFIHSVIPVIPVHWFPGVGALITIILVILTGMATRKKIGEVIIRMGNKMMANIPIVNKVYVGIQQVIDAVVKSDKKVFKRVALIEFPKKNSYALGFVTSENCGEIQRKTQPDIISVFVPTTPNPTSGFLLYADKNEIIELDMSVEIAMKLVMSAGVLNPDTLKRTDRLYQFSGAENAAGWMAFLKGKDRRGSSADPRD